MTSGISCAIMYLEIEESEKNTMRDCWLIWSWYGVKSAEDKIHKELGKDIRTEVHESYSPSYYELEVETEFPEQMARVEDILAKFV